MKRSYRLIFLAFFLALTAAASSVNAVMPGELLDPVLNHGEKWRVGYIEGGHYNDYPPILKAMITSLARLGWIEADSLDCLDQADTTQQVWQCLTQQIHSDYIEFLPDAFWSADWIAGRREQNRREFIARSNLLGDIDLMIAMGTWAGQDLANNQHKTPTIVLSTSNAISSGIIKSVEDSGFDHIHAKIDPTRYARQVRLFYDVVGFKKLGIVYEDTLEGRSYAGMEQIEPVARELGFTIVPCNAPFSGVSLAEAEQAVVQCHEKLAPKVDAIYITIHRGVNKKNMHNLLEPLFKYRVPNFAMGTLYEVRYGALMSMAQPNFNHAGDFAAKTAAKIFNGVSPGNISQILEDPHRIIVNIEAAKKIGFDFPMDILGGADEIVEKIMKSEN